MRRIRQAVLIFASLLSVSALAAAPVAAHAVADVNGSSGSGSSSNDSSEQNITPHVTQTETGSETETETEVHGLQDKAKTFLEGQRKAGTGRTEAKRKLACKAHEAEINNRVNNYAAAAERHLNTFNDIFSKVQNFYTTKQLNVDGYDALVVTAKDKQTAAQNAVDVLKALDINIDCTQSDPAQSVATVKSAVSDARTALKDYRAAIKEVIAAIKGASSAFDNTSSAGGNQ